MFNFIQNIKKINFPFPGVELYFDLGTSTTRIAIKDKGIVLREPTCLGCNIKTKEYIFIGREAKTIIGKTPDFIKIVRPVVNGVISDFDAEVALIRTFLEKSVFLYFSRHFIKPSLTVITTIPTIATEIEQKALEEAILKAGGSNIFIIQKPLVTGAGSNLNIFSHQPNLIADLGGGLIELAIISGGGIVCHKTLKNAGEHMNKLIYNYIYLKYGVILGEATCEYLKMNVLSFANEDKTATIRGKSLETGLPKSVRVRAPEIKEALLSNFNLIIDGIKELIEASPPEVVDEIFKRGVVLTGGLANIKGIDNFFAGEIKMDVFCVGNPLDTTINGLIKISRRHDDILKLRVS